MRWDILDREHSFDDLNLLGDGDKLKKVEEVELVFDDGSITGLIISLKDGREMCFTSRKVDEYGCHEQLCVSIAKGTY